MRIISFAKGYVLALIAIVLLTACNGPSDENNAGSGDDSLTIAFHSYEQGVCGAATTDISFTSGSSFCVVARLTRNEASNSGQLLSFTSTFGSVAPTTKLTDAEGQAEVVLSNSDATQGAGTVTVNYTGSTGTLLTATANFEFTAASGDGQTFQLHSGIEQNGMAVTRIKVGDTVQLQAQITDDQNQAVSNALVTFTAGGATLQPSTALTNSSGLAQVPFTPTVTDLGASSLGASVTLDGRTLNTSSLFEVLSNDAVEDSNQIQLGHFADGEFIAGQLGTSLPPDRNGRYLVSAGGSFGLTATLVTVDPQGVISRLQAPTSVSFSSDCSSGGNAKLDSPVTSVSGDAMATFEDSRCSGNTERNDVITANAVIGSQSLAATLPFTLARQTLANLSFISAEPKTIRIKGAGGTGSSESSLVTFKVLSANGQPASQQSVEFSLDTVVGGLSFANGATSASGLSNALGEVSVRVLSGTVPTPVRVTATATDSDTGTKISSQSEQLTVNTGLPQQLAFSLSTSLANPEAGSMNGNEVTITAYAADSFANPVPDDTSINFTTEGGQIQPSCVTLNGRCSVVWTSSEPRVQDNRITILAYALGHETFFDTNGNNIFDADDGGVIVDACLDPSANEIACSGNGMDIDTYHSAGFSDLGDPFRDDNENASHDSGEPYFNLAGSTTYQVGDGLFNGPQCQGSLCGQGIASKSYIRKALIMTMAGSQALMTVSSDGSTLVDPSGQLITPTLAATASRSFMVNLTDTSTPAQILPAGTVVTVTSSLGAISFDGYQVPNTNSQGGTNTSFVLTHNGNGGSALVTITATTPSNIVSQTRFNVSLL
ncbi:Ig-like domain-containing protein [Shewanella sp. NIFS-20-20]|uniref:Ig-like domain-containing protein n=1 Tax=Shewanella sp. NIFS-20-20 TaxID=2853806 RepID=UPI001C48BE2E|nr:Ig-like domain-containing protein [Shewanella sp. NIFS-20-20]MBV7317474.1 Ig-like domain-containing protein [Shewanella sp. NIFS-20-20]